jgi:uncharacterized phiE125 gp8 family phage protein
MRLLGVELVEPPATLPVTVQEFIDHGRLNGLTVDRQPDLILRQITAATRRAERYLRRSIITQTLKGFYGQDNLPCDEMMILPRGRVQSVTSVTSNGAVSDPAGYTLTGNVITFSTPFYAPAEVIWVSGYGDEGDSVPDSVREGILEYATVLYCDRMGMRESKYAAGAFRTLPAGIQDLWRPEQIEVSG